MRNIYFILLLLVFLVNQTIGQEDFCIYSLFIILSVRLLDKFGKSITLREFIALYSCIIYLLMPLLGYKFYTSKNLLANLWVKYMPISKAVYFAFVLPALNVFFLALFSPRRNGTEELDSNRNMINFLDRIRIQLKHNPGIWKPIFILGLLGYFGNLFFSTGALHFFFFTFYLFLFTTILYILFSSGFKNKYLIIISILILLVFDAIQSGMFTMLFYMGITMASILFVGMRLSFLKKLLMVSIVLVLVTTLQLSKRSYRTISWKSNFEGSKTTLLWEIMSEKFSSLDEIFDKNNFFPIYVRMNQGYNVALVMKRIPSNQPFDNGNSILLTIGSAIVPRFLWEDKMRSGGIYNMKHFAGFNLRGWSTNIGPVGEAYGNFGVFGGILFMFIFGFFIRWIYFKVLIMANTLPLLIFWIPVLFFELSYSMENDLLQALNSVIKISIFLYIIYLIYPKIFGVKAGIKTPGKSINHQSTLIPSN